MTMGGGECDREAKREASEERFHRHKKRERWRRGRSAQARFGLAESSGMHKTRMTDEAGGGVLVLTRRYPGGRGQGRKRRIEGRREKGGGKQGGAYAVAPPIVP